jgi:hypothetical protein
LELHRIDRLRFSIHDERKFRRFEIQHIVPCGIGYDDVDHDDIYLFPLDARRQPSLRGLNC